MTPRPAAALAFAAALAVSFLFAPGRSHAGDGRWIGSLELGFDTFSERYSVAEEDTLSSINEARTRLRFGYARGSMGRNYALFEARQYLGESSYETTAHTFVTRRFGESTAWMATLDAELARRGFREGTTYDFPNDYTRASARAGVRVRVSSLLTARLDDRVEHLDYERRTEFDYDYTRNVATAAVEVGRDPFRILSAGVRHSTMSIPDSAGIEYHALGPVLEVRAFGAAHERVYVSMSADRRSYPNGGTRSSFWSILLSGMFEWPVHRHWGIEMAADIEDYDYDVTSGIYNDYLETRAYVAANWFNDGTRIGAGPAFGWLSSRNAPQDEYRELGVRIAAEHIGARGLYVSASYEPGVRDYESYAGTASTIDGTEVVFSDYGYRRINVFANVRVHGALWLNLFFDYQPEDHDRDGDDATATVGSISLTYSF